MGASQTMLKKEARRDLVDGFETQFSPQFLSPLYYNPGGWEI